MSISKMKNNICTFVHNTWFILSGNQRITELFICMKRNDLMYILFNFLYLIHISITYIDVVPRLARCLSPSRYKLKYVKIGFCFVK